jgi:hypothetical protein
MIGDGAAACGEDIAAGDWSAGALVSTCRLRKERKKILSG